MNIRKLLSIAISVTLVSTQISANVLGDFQTFVPNTDGLFFITVDSAQTLKKNTIVGNAYLSYAKDYLLVNDNITNQKRINYKDEVTSLDGTIGYSFTDNLQAFVGVTQLLDYSADDSQSTNYTLSKGVHSFRPGFKWKFASEKESSFAVITSVDLLNVENDPYTGEDPPSIYNLGFAWSGNLGGRSTHGFNFGFRQREPGSVTVDSTFYPLKSQATFSYGYSYPSSPKTRWIFETIGCMPVDKGDNKSAQDISCLEFLGAARHRFNSTWALVAGATVEPGVQTMAPAYRGFAGVNVYLYPSSSAKKSESAASQLAMLQVPEKVQLAPGQIYLIPISGGLPPYACEIIEGVSLSSLQDCTFTAPDFSDITRVEVSDDSGQARIIELVTEEETDGLTLEPVRSRVYTGTQLEFVASGGEYPYRYKILSGGGQMMPTSGMYRAPLKPGWATIEATDKKNQKVTAEVEIVIPPVANKTITLKNVNFIFNTTTLVPESKVKLENAIQVLSELKIREIIVGGHTDNIGSAEYNIDLSERRAMAIADILIDRLNLDAAKVKYVGYGFEKPLVPNKDDASRLKNRRVELSIYTKD